MTGYERPGIGFFHPVICSQAGAGAVRDSWYAAVGQGGDAMRPTTERWFLVGLGMLTTVAATTFLVVRPMPWPAWLLGASEAATPLAVRDSGLPQTFLVTPGDGRITIVWPSGDRADRYQVEAVDEADNPVAQPCLPAVTSTSVSSMCVISNVRNGGAYVVTVRPAKDADTATPPRLVRVVPRPAILAAPSTVAWFDASDYDYVEPDHPGSIRIGSRVVRLRDKSSHHFDASQPDPARQPTFGQLGRLPALDLDGDDVLIADGRSFPSGGRPSTVVAVAAQDDPAPESTCFRNLLAWGTAELAQARVLHKGCRTSRAFAETWGTFAGQEPTQPWPIGRPAVVSAVFDASATSVRLNGAAFYRWEAPATQRMNTVLSDGAQIGGASWDLSAGWLGRIGEVVVFDRVLTAAELTAVEGYLSTKWQVPLDQQ